MIINKPIVFFDLETTGVNTVKDRIVQISIIKIDEEGVRTKKTTLINPGIKIPAEATEIHGITDQHVIGAPKFHKIAKSLIEQLSDCDMAGFNSDNFDVPMLIEEFSRAGLEYPIPGQEINFIDVLKLERIINSHKLTETYKRYTGNDLEGAHDAEADTKATIEVLFAQLETFDKEMTVQEIDELCQGDKKRHDYAGKLYEKDGVVYWNFGKHQDKAVTEEPQYADWVIRSDFPTDTKNKLKKILE
jgi:DNA polymerase-3 subunit epsilon